MKTEEQMLRDELAQCEASAERIAADNTRLREAVKTLREAVRRDGDALSGAAWSLNGKHSRDINYAVRKGEAALAATANLVKD